MVCNGLMSLCFTTPCGRFSNKTFCDETVIYGNLLGYKRIGFLRKFSLNRNSLNFLKRHPKTSLSEGLNRFREKGTILKRSTAGRPDADREKKKDEKTDIETDCLIEPQ